MKRFPSHGLRLAFLLSATGFGLLDCRNREEPKDPQLVIAKKYQKYCSNCHGGDGTLSINGAVKLKYSLLSADERYLVITNGRNTMTGFAGILDSAERAGLAHYTLKFANAGSNGN